MCMHSYMTQKGIPNKPYYPLMKGLPCETFPTIWQYAVADM